MAFSVNVPTALEYFASLVQSDEHLPLLEAATSLALDAYPDLDISATLSDVDQMAHELKRRLAADAPALQRLRTLNQYFYGQLGFGGNLNHYYDPDNSFLPAVISRRRGIPVSLAVLWMDLAESMGLKVSGVSFPGHFLVKIVLPNGQAVLDPVNGMSLSRDDLLERLAPLVRQSAGGDTVAAQDALLALSLKGATPREILARMLRNLKDIYSADEDWSKAIPMMDRLIVLIPDHWDYYKDRGLIHAEQGDWAEAVRDLSTYLDHTEDLEEHDRVSGRLAEIRAQQS